MPISRKAFEKGISPEEDSIVAFLDKNPTQAYTQEEIAKALGRDYSSLTNMLWIQITLTRLVNSRLIRYKGIGGKPYYASARDFSKS